MADGNADNNLNIVVVVEWSTSDGTASLEYVYNNEEVMRVNNGSWDYALILNYVELGINISTINVYAKVETDSGATVYSENWDYSEAKPYEP